MRRALSIDPRNLEVVGSIPPEKQSETKVRNVEVEATVASVSDVFVVKVHRREDTTLKVH